MDQIGGGPLRDPGDRLDVDIPEEPRALRRIRLLVAEAVSAIVPIPQMTDVVIVVSELVANAIVHGTEPRHLGVTVTPSSLEIEVTNGGDGVVSRDAQPGHGLHVVALLADDWGVESGPDRIRVWCRMTRHRP